MPPRPWVAEGSEDRLDENMVISIEPGIYLRGVGGVRHSDTVLITKDGYELLTRHPTELRPLTVQDWKPFARFKGYLVKRALNLDVKSRVAGAKSAQLAMIRLIRAPMSRAHVIHRNPVTGWSLPLKEGGDSAARRSPDHMTAISCQVDRWLLCCLCEHSFLQ